MSRFPVLVSSAINLYLQRSIHVAIVSVVVVVVFVIGGVRIVVLAKSCSGHYCTWVVSKDHYKHTKFMEQKGRHTSIRLDQTTRRFRCEMWLEFGTVLSLVCFFFFFFLVFSIVAAECDFLLWWDCIARCFLFVFVSSNCIFRLRWVLVLWWEVVWSWFELWSSSSFESGGGVTSSSDCIARSICLGITPMRWVHTNDAGSYDTYLFLSLRIFGLMLKRGKLDHLTPNLARIP